jgi:hypothetical protein
MATPLRILPESRSEGMDRERSDITEGAQEAGSWRHVMGTVLGFPTTQHGRNVQRTLRQVRQERHAARRGWHQSWRKQESALKKDWRKQERRHQEWKEDRKKYILRSHNIYDDRQLDDPRFARAQQRAEKKIFYEMRHADKKFQQQRQQEKEKFRRDKLLSEKGLERDWRNQRRQAVQRLFEQYQQSSAGKKAA